ncbi:tetraacyldisaccharide 4'-kinase [Legionella hackeliae]|uniref:Tetraacyldisaccharide 4'-kinase n=1 Tax=Legionella hackeliae TaxID=449 RepID=A0A0A8URZ8_LEGHA|nr:tetraacyldisaccharide 4'-kinase [Legionella hackeliae]KTD10378.1 tetraacyldisaccharide 4'-kinase [Legionella hackeliae]CEK09877.1 Tetraacyldisaccharide 4'-kinase [Legionella hackeliae]STX49787.1 tetraacyldisaccharide 4'-kinase [Legionella hackeliae]
MNSSQYFSLSIDALWYKKHPIRWLLWPIAQCYKLITSIRRFYLLHFRQQHFPVPIIVVGNLTVGGVGKTPLVITLAKNMCAKGLRVGIVSRGYGATLKQFPHEVSSSDDALLVGDEPLLIARKTNCPVVIAPKRTQAVQYLLDKHQSEIIISDDGLQHYAMGRAVEIVVIDGVRGLGNELCLPAGPLRESSKRLQKADFIVINGDEQKQGYSMSLTPGSLTHLLTGQKISKESLTAPVAAVAAIGHPQRFFTTLHNLGISFKKYPFPDHHHFQPHELQFREKIVVMTEKDAVKCQSFAANSWYFLPVEATLSESFWHALWSHKQLQGYI